MTATAYKNYTTRIKNTPQTMKIPGREKDQIVNNAGGVSFKIDAMAQFRRFLILGSEGGSYYVSEQKLTSDNAKNAKLLLDSPSGFKAVQLIAEVSTNNLAPKVSPILFALALAMSSDNVTTKHEAMRHFNDIVRTNSHMLEFISYANEMRGWGRLLRETVQQWYATMGTDKLAYQVAKYRNRSKWTTRDALRMCKPKTENTTRNAIYRWAVGKGLTDEAPKLLATVEEANALTHLTNKRKVSEACKLIEEASLTREMIPNTWLDKPQIWDVLLQSMPMTAMIRNLGKMSSVGLITSFSEAAKLVCNRLGDVEYLRRSRIHPMGILLALSTYKEGCGVKGNLLWDPVSSIIDALDKAFYTTFQNVEPTNKNTLLALDVSGSMGMYQIMNTHLSCMEASAAMALVTMNTEPNYEVFGFSHKFVPLDITKSDSINGAILKMSKVSFGGTDCSLPMLYAMNNKLPVESFVIYTDNETWAGRNGHPSQVLQKYRNQSGIQAKLCTVGMVATQSSIADPRDPGMLDVVGFDASAPTIMAEFFRS